MSSRPLSTRSPGPAGRRWRSCPGPRAAWSVLHALLVADGRVVSAEELLEGVRDVNADPFTNTVRVTVMKLRKKLGDPLVIETLPGAGYRI
jgi:DNA-binding response OmpR family regulator